MEKIGEILLDSGVLVFGDLVEIKKINHLPHQTQRIFIDNKTKQLYKQGLDFQRFTDILLDNKNVNQLLAENILEEVKSINTTELSSENILNNLEKGFKQIDFENGTAGKAFAALLAEGVFSVYAEMGENGIEKLLIDFKKE
jgi:glutamate synthase domain-containing protein 3